MSNSSLVSYTRISPNRTSPRRGKISKIVIHHMAGNLSVETCGNVFAPSSRQASSHYGIGSDGRIGMYCEEKDRAWTTGNQIDHQAVTIEVADDVMGGNWHSSDAALKSLVLLCADICRRNGIANPTYTGDGNGTFLMHKWYQNTDCPGAFLESKFPWIAQEVRKQLNGENEKPKPKQIPGNPINNMQLWYRAHCQGVGWLDPVRDGQVAGTVGFSKRLEAIMIDLRKIREKYPDAKLSAKAHIQGIGWVSYDNVEHDTVIGTVGQGKRLEAIELELTGVPGKNIYAQTHLAKFGWTGYIAGGFASGTVGIKTAVEAMRLKVA